MGCKYESGQPPQEGIADDGSLTMRFVDKLPSSGGISFSTVRPHRIHSPTSCRRQGVQHERANHNLRRAETRNRHSPRVGEVKATSRSACTTPVQADSCRPRQAASIGPWAPSNSYVNSEGGRVEQRVLVVAEEGVSRGLGQGTGAGAWLQGSGSVRTNSAVRLWSLHCVCLAVRLPAVRFAERNRPRSDSNRMTRVSLDTWLTH